SVYLFLWLVVFRVRMPGATTPLDYTVFVFGGLVPYLFLTQTLSSAATSVPPNIHLVESGILPIELIPTPGLAGRPGAPASWSGARCGAERRQSHALDSRRDDPGDRRAGSADARRALVDRRGTRRPRPGHRLSGDARDDAADVRVPDRLSPGDGAGESAVRRLA